MKYFMLAVLAVFSLVLVNTSEATNRGRLRQRNRVEKVVKVERVVVDNHHKANVVVEKVVVEKPVYQNVVVERVVVDNHGNKQRVRTVERIRVR